MALIIPATEVIRPATAVTITGIGSPHACVVCVGTGGELGVRGCADLFLAVVPGLAGRPRPAQVRPPAAMLSSPDPVLPVRPVWLPAPVAASSGPEFVAVSILPNRFANAAHTQISRYRRER
jgi:hypothetical protein